MSSINSHPKINVKLKGYGVEKKKGHWVGFLAPRTQPLCSFLSCLLLFLVFSLDESREGERQRERAGVKEEVQGRETGRQRAKRRTDMKTRRGGEKRMD